MPFFRIETSDTGMSVFTVSRGANDKNNSDFALKNGKKSPDMVVSERDFDKRRNKNKYQQITENSCKIHIYGVY